MAGGDCQGLWAGPWGAGQRRPPRGLCPDYRGPSIAQEQAQVCTPALSQRPQHRARPAGVWG